MVCLACGEEQPKRAMSLRKVAGRKLWVCHDGDACFERFYKRYYKRWLRKKTQPDEPGAPR